MCELNPFQAGNQRGVTLIELIMALSLGAVVLLAASGLYRTVAWSSKAEYTDAFLQDQAMIVMAELRKQIEFASAIAACYPGSNCLVDSCDGQDGSSDSSKFLYVLNPDGIYCFYRSSDGKFKQFREPPGAIGQSWDMLSGSPAPLIVTTFDICGLPPYSTGTCQSTAEIAYVSFRLQAPEVLGGASAAPTLAFSAAIAKRPN
jgi:prepilin-type N-terminal cleavage/methylation domain-containing protein